MNDLSTLQGQAAHYRAVRARLTGVGRSGDIEPADKTVRAPAAIPYGRDRRSLYRSPFTDFSQRPCQERNARWRPRENG